MVAIIGNFSDLLDPRFQRIYNEEYEKHPDMIDNFYAKATAKLYTERFSSVGTLPDVGAFGGMVTYNDVSQGYDTAVTPLEFAAGFQVQRRLFDTDQFFIIDSKPKALAQSFWRTRQSYAARPFNNAFSVDTFFANNSENVAMCSNSHTTTSGASTASGFDNLTTASLSATSLAAMRKQMIGFRGDQAEPIAMMPDELIIHPDLYDVAYEIVGSQGKPDTANNNANVHYGQYKVTEWQGFLTDSNNYFLVDSSMMKSWGLVWLEPVSPEFAFVEDFDSLIGKWRTYGVFGNAWLNWRFILGAQVS
jgi:hypothetical protein